MAFVRELVATLSAHPDLASWLVSDGMIRRFVVVVDNVANGANPAQQIPFMRPAARFATTGSSGGLAVDPQSYRRYNGHAQIIDSLDRQGAADIYQTLEPLMDEAYRELGYPDRRFRQSLELAVSHLLATPIIDRPPEIIEYPPFYRYRDDELEDLSAVQKQFLGMGPAKPECGAARSGIDRAGDRASSSVASTARLTCTSVHPPWFSRRQVISCDRCCGSRCARQTYPSVTLMAMSNGCERRSRPHAPKAQI